MDYFCVLLNFLFFQSSKWKSERRCFFRKNVQILGFFCKIFVLVFLIKAKQKITKNNNKNTLIYSRQYLNSQLKKIGSLFPLSTKTITGLFVIIYVDINLLLDPNTTLTPSPSLVLYKHLEMWVYVNGCWVFMRSSLPLFFLLFISVFSLFV